MGIEEVSYDGQIYLKNCIITERMINNIINLHKNQGISPVIKIHIGAQGKPDLKQGSVALSAED